MDIDINYNILKRAEEKTAVQDYIEICHKALLCPKCGGELGEYTEEHEDSDYYAKTIYTCKHCLYQSIG